MNHPLRSLFLLFSFLFSLAPSSPAQTSGQFALQKKNAGAGYTIVPVTPVNNGIWTFDGSGVLTIASSLSQSSITNLSTDLANKQPLDADLTAIASIPTSSFGRSLLDELDASTLRTTAGLVIGTDVLAPSGNGSALTGLTKSQVGLGSVENTALSTWAGTSSITTLGTISTGTWNATAISTSKAGVPTGGSTGQVLTKSSNTNYDYVWSAPAGGGAYVNVQKFTSSGTWIKPAGAKYCYVLLIGGGGGGGGGISEPAPGNYLSGGSGGAAGGFIEVGFVDAAPMSDSGVIVGAGGTGGSANNPGNAGGSTIFYTMEAPGGGGGLVGVSNGSSMGGTPGGTQTNIGLGRNIVNIGLGGGGNNGSSGGDADASPGVFPTGGGGGGGVDNGGNGYNGGGGGYTGAGWVPNGTGGNFASGDPGYSSATFSIGTGGGGGGGGTNTSGYNGGAGGTYGGGGGGGGSGVGCGASGGAGGDGGGGLLLIITYCTP